VLVGVAVAVFVGVLVGVLVGVAVAVFVGVAVAGASNWTAALMARTRTSREAGDAVPVFKTPISRVVEPFLKTPDVTPIF